MLNMSKLDKTSSIGEHINNTMSDDYLEQITDLKRNTNRDPHIFLEENTADGVNTARDEKKKINLDEVKDKQKGLGSGRNHKKEV